MQDQIDTTIAQAMPDGSGTVEEVVFHNDNTGYSVIRLIDEKSGELVSAVGSLPFISEGEYVLLWGTWTKHAEYGKQLNITRYEKSLPTDTSDILRYLSSRTIKGIGPSTALKIVSRFGRETFEVMEKHPEWLTDIPGISPKKASAIGKSFQEQAKLRDLMTLCAGKMSSESITRIFSYWGNNATSIIRSNPYRLSGEIYGIGFKRADAIAKQVGIAHDADVRIVGGLEYVLQTAAQVNGHTCLPIEDLLSMTAEKLELEREKINECLTSELKKGTFVLRTYETQKVIYLRGYDSAEEDIARKLCELSRNAVTFSRENLMRMIERMENEWSIQYATRQREAIGTALSSGVMVLTGGPGTGKTTVIRALIRLFEMLDMDPVLLAPTGRAAKRMSEATIHEARTIHRALEMVKTDYADKAKFVRNEDNPLDAMAVIVDESSMIDLPLMHALVRAMRRGSHLILVGDADQLPSVGCGNVLADMIAAGVFPVVALDEVFRQSETGQIVTNANRINHGEMPILSEKTGDFFFLPRWGDDATLTTLLSLVRERLPRAYGADILDHLQIITSTRRGRLGTELLNVQLQACLNPQDSRKKEIKFRQVVFREGDRVMQIRNNYELEWTRGTTKGSGIFNGDMGRILSIDTEESCLTISFDDREVVYDMNLLDELEHAYAITVHKSQGSEYPVVLMPLCYGGPFLQTRNLLYTAITRAKRMVILIGREAYIQQMVENNHRAVRYTHLKNRLISVESAHR